MVLIEGTPWFVAADVCRALGMPGFPSTYTNRLSSDEKRVLRRGEVSSFDLETSLFVSKTPTVTLISESGLYKLVMRSDKPEARSFQDWVTRVVLPAIRKDGMYVAGDSWANG